MSKEPKVNPLDSNYENLTNKLSACAKVKEMMASEGWLELVAPRITNMINELGGAPNKQGLLTRGRVAESADPYQLATNIGIKLGMENIYNMIVSYAVNYEAYKERMEGMEKRSNEEPKDYMGGYE